MGEPATTVDGIREALRDEALRLQEVLCGVRTLYASVQQCTELQRWRELLQHEAAETLRDRASLEPVAGLAYALHQAQERLEGLVFIVTDANDPEEWGAAATDRRLSRWAEEDAALAELEAAIPRRQKTGSADPLNTGPCYLDLDGRLIPIPAGRRRRPVHLKVLTNTRIPGL